MSRCSRIWVECYYCVMIMCWCCVIRNMEALIMLLKYGAKTNVKDNVRTTFACNL